MEELPMEFYTTEIQKTASIYYYSNFTNGNEIKNSDLSGLWVISVSILFRICSATTAIANLIVILSFVVNKVLRKFSNYLILNLAISDFTVGVFSINFFAGYVTNGDLWKFGKQACVFWLVIDYVASNTSAINLLVICFDRYIATSRPIWYRKHSTNKAVIVVILSTWAVSFLLWAPAIIFADNSVHDKSCYLPFLHESPPVTIVTAVLAFYLPSCTMCLLYWKTVTNISSKIPHQGSASKILDSNEEVMEPVQKNKRLKWPRSLNTNTDNNKKSVLKRKKKRTYWVNTQRDNRERPIHLRITRMAFIVVLCFIVLWLPYNITVILSSLGYNILNVVWNIGYAMCYLNSTINPLIYATFNVHFRRTFKLLLTQKWWNSSVRRNFRRFRPR